MNNIRLKYLVSEKITTGASESANDYSPNETRYIRISDFDEKGNIREDVKVSITNEKAANYLLEERDILIAVTGGTVGKSMIFNLSEKAAYAGYLARIRTNEKLNYKYLWYYLNSPLFQKWRKEAINVSTIENISAGKYADLPVVYHEINYQNAIVELLDTKFSMLDQLIENQVNQIDELQLYKQSLIHEVVTRGINYDNNLKDSGVDWIGKLNTNYELKPIGALFEIKKDIAGSNQYDVLSITQDGIKIKDISTNSGQMAQSYDKYQVVEIGDFAMNHMDLLTGWIDISKYMGVTSPDYRVFKSKTNQVFSNYYLYIFQNYYKNKVFYGFGQGVSNLGRWRLPAKNFLSIKVPFPSFEEQVSICKYLNEKTNKIDTLLKIKQQKIEELKKYKNTIIYEYITLEKVVS